MFSILIDIEHGGGVTPRKRLHNVAIPQSPEAAL